MLITFPAFTTTLIWMIIFPTRAKVKTFSILPLEQIFFYHYSSTDRKWVSYSSLEKKEKIICLGDGIHSYSQNQVMYSHMYETFKIQQSLII